MIDALEKAKELVQDAYYDERGLSDVMRQDAAIWATIAQAEAQQRIAVHLGNIHQTLITPNVDREPTTAADQLKRMGDLLEGWMKVQGVLPEYFEAVNRIRLYEDRIYELERMTQPGYQEPSPSDNF